MGAAVLDYADERHIGFSKFISIGNKADVDENDCLEAFEHDDDVGVIILYLENFDDPRRFAEICSRITPRKPVLVLKGGRSKTGAKAATSHTGALAGSDRAVDALLDRCGAIRVENIEELLVDAHFFSSPKRPKGDRIGLVTNAGGPGIIATDELEKRGFLLSELDKKTIEELENTLPPEASCANPCDVLPGTGAEGYRVASEAMVKDPNIDALVILFLCPVMVKPEWLVDAIIPVAQSSPIPIIGLFMGAIDVVETATPLAKMGVPILRSAPEVTQALRANKKYNEFLARKSNPPLEFPVDRKRADAIVKRADEGWLESDDAFALLDAYGIPIVKSVTAPFDGDILAAVSGMEYPLVMKIVSPDILHKSDVGGVELNITSPENLLQRHKKMLECIKSSQPSARLDGVLLQEMVTWQTQLIVGVNREPGFGPMIMCGLGGIFVEVMKDVVFSLAPLPAEESRRMLHSLRSLPILQGVRGTEGIDIDAVADVIARISQLATDYPKLDQLDINPLLAGPEGCCAVDVRMKLV
jgi:acetyltransferase